MKVTETLRKAIHTHYAKVAQGNTQGCCGGGGCCGPAASAGEAARQIGYTQSDLGSIPDAANMGLGCGNPLALAALRTGETVLDLGCGGGLDCFLASPQVGDSGRVIGVDMTPEMIALARKNMLKGQYANVEFRLGEIENLPVADGIADVAISNCVINLSMDKQQVFREIYRVLKPGGRLCVSDVVALAPMPEAVRRDAALVAGCIGGAEQADALRAMLQAAGFADIKLEPKAQSREIIRSWGFAGNPDDYTASCDIRASKPAAPKIV